MALLEVVMADVAKLCEEERETTFSDMLAGQEMLINWVETLGA